MMPISSACVICTQGAQLVPVSCSYSQSWYNNSIRTLSNFKSSVQTKLQSTDQTLIMPVLWANQRCIWSMKVEYKIAC